MSTALRGKTGKLSLFFLSSYGCSFTMLEDKILAEQIVHSLPFFQLLLREGCARVDTIVNAGGLDIEIKGRYKTGVTDYVTRADIELGELYASQIGLKFPEWGCILEDGVEKIGADELSEKNVIVFFDPVDGTRLLAQGLPGSSSMAAVAVRENDYFKPVLGAMKLFSGEEMYGYKVLDRCETSGFTYSTRTRDELILCRSDTDRQGFLIPLCRELSYTQVILRGVAPKMKAMLDGEIDFFVFEPGITYWDIFPVMGILNACGGKAVDWRGGEIVYNGLSKSVNHGFLAMAPGVCYESIIEKVAGIYSRL